MNLQPVDFKAVAAKGFFVYVYLREKDLTPYYVGLSKNFRRPFDRHCVKVPVDACRVRVLKSGLSRQQAIEWEVFYIDHYGRVDMNTGILRNATPGGDGNTEMSEATKQKLSRSKSGISTPALRAAMKKRGRVRSPMSAEEREFHVSRLASFSGQPEVVAKMRDTKLRESYESLSEKVVSFEEWRLLSKADRKLLVKNLAAAAFLGVSIAVYRGWSRAERISQTKIRKAQLGVLGTKATGPLLA